MDLGRLIKTEGAGLVECSLSLKAALRGYTQLGSTIEGNRKKLVHQHQHLMYIIRGL